MALVSLAAVPVAGQAPMDLTLAPEHIAALDRLSQPTLNFPAPLLRMASAVIHAGATVNGEPSQAWPMAHNPKSSATESRPPIHI